MTVAELADTVLGAALKQRISWMFVSPPVDPAGWLVKRIGGAGGSHVHPLRAGEPAPDGSLTWQATVSGTVEIRSWILGWGADVEVLAPAELRAEIATITAAAAAHYPIG